MGPIDLDQSNDRELRYARRKTVAEYDQGCDIEGPKVAVQH